MAQDFPDSLEIRCNHFEEVTFPNRANICKYIGQCKFKLRKNEDNHYCRLSDYFLNKPYLIANTK